MLKRAAFVVSIVSVLFAGLVVAQEGEGDPSAPAEATAPAEPDLSTAATMHETIASGALPPLAGRWLLIDDLDLAGKNRGIAAFWEVTDEGGSPKVVERFVNLPEDLNAQLNRQNEIGEKWEPTEQDLATIRAGWAALPDQMRGVQQVRNEIWAKDAFIDEIKQEEATKDAEWVVRQTYQFAPGGNRPVRQVNILGALEETPTGFRGNYSGVAVAVAPFPVPIPFKGTFRMYRLDPKPVTGFFARLGDLFKGCGR
jgi:hypothetical protein